MDKRSSLIKRSNIPSTVNEPTPIHLSSYCGTWHLQSKNWPLSYNSGMVDDAHLHVLTCRCAPFSLGISETAGRIALKYGLWLGTHLPWRFTKVNAGIQVQVRTCTHLFRISGTAGRIALKLGAWLEYH